MYVCFEFLARPSIKFQVLEQHRSVPMVTFLDPPPRAADKWGSSEWLHDMITWPSCTGMGNESAVHVVA